MLRGRSRRAFYGVYRPGKTLEDLDSQIQDVPGNIQHMFALLQDQQNLIQSVIKNQEELKVSFCYTRTDVLIFHRLS